MTEPQAREILLLYRPGTSDAGDPEVVEAFALVRRSPELQQWFDQHCAAQKAIAAGFKKIPVPEGLKEQILSERKAHSAGFLPKNPAGVALALAVFCIAAALVVYVFGPEWNRFDQASFTSYRGRMIFTALENYRMDLETNSVASVRSYFAGRQALADWTVPPGLSQARVTGCGVVNWHGTPVSMVCFNSGNHLPSGQKTDVWLFVVDQAAPHRAPGTAPEFAKVSNLSTASWRADGKIYLLAVQGDEKVLQNFLGAAPPG